VKRSYHTIDKQGKVGDRKLTEFLVHNGQALLPMLELIEQSRMAVDELIDVMGRGQHRGRAGAVGAAGGRVTAARQNAGGGHWLARNPTRSGVSEGAPITSEQAAPSPKGPRCGQGGAGSGLRALQKETATGERMLQILLNGVSTRRISE